MEASSLQWIEEEKELSMGTFATCVKFSGISVAKVNWRGGARLMDFEWCDHSWLWCPFLPAINIAGVSGALSILSWNNCSEKNVGISFCDISHKRGLVLAPSKSPKPYFCLRSKKTWTKIGNMGKKKVVSWAESNKLNRLYYMKGSEGCM